MTGSPYLYSYRGEILRDMKMIYQVLSQVIKALRKTAITLHNSVVTVVNKCISLFHSTHMRIFELALYNNQRKCKYNSVFNGDKND